MILAMEILFVKMDSEVSTTMENLSPWIKMEEGLERRLTHGCQDL